MNDFLLYILKSTTSISLLYLAFRILMRKETFFKLNRVLLLSVVIFSAIIPATRLPQSMQPATQNEWIPALPEKEIIQVYQTISEESVPAITAPTEQTKPLLKEEFPWLKLVQNTYLAGIIISFLILIYGIMSILVLFRKARFMQMDGFRLLIIDHEVPPFSFGRFVIISQADYDTHQQTILVHEEAHIRLNHFFDLAVLETIKLFHWFNPAMYWLIRDMKEIHEFQADNYTITSGIDATQYQILIIQKSVGPQRFALANSFNHCQIKNRITMMNKQKTSKAWRWKVATFLPLLALLLVFCGRKGGNEPPTNSVQIKDQTFRIDCCEVANKSFENTSKFELDLFVKNSNGLLDSVANKNLIYLSVASKELSDLAEGEYTFSQEGANARPAMTFYGDVWIKDKKLGITDGNFILKRDSNKVNIVFHLKIEENNKLDGNYLGSFIYTNRSQNTISEMMPTPQPKPKIKISEPGLLIEFTKDGNYINNQLYSKDDFIKKVKELTNDGKSSKNQFTFVSPDFELSDSRNIELTAISNATGIPFVPNLGVDQQAVFAGGTSGMFAWIKQNAKFQIRNMAFSWSKNVTIEFIVNTQGKAVDAKIVQAISPELNREAIRIIYQMPAWKPAIKNGNPVSVVRRLTIPFK
jgi:hypothetical protein